jgi:diguanylate cyclase (GGDEF)-like protein/PAS domain S-box-containing protein
MTPDVTGQATDNQPKPAGTEGTPPAGETEALRGDLTAAVKLLNEAILLLDKQGIVTDCTAGAARLLGSTPADLIGRPSTLWAHHAPAMPVPPQQRRSGGGGDDIDRMVNNWFTTGPETQVPARVAGLVSGGALPAAPNPSGNGSATADRSLAQVTGADGVSRQLLVSSVQVPTGRLMSLVELPDSEDAEAPPAPQLEAVRKLSDIGLWEQDFATGKLTWSPQMFILCGMRPHESPPSPDEWLDWIHPEDRERILRQEKQALASRTSWKTTYRFVARDGMTRHVRGWGYVVVGPDGHPTGVAGAVLDVTGSDVAALELKRQRRRLNAATKLTGLASWSMRADGQAVWWSEEMYPLHGRSSRTAAPNLQAYLQMLHPDDRASLVRCIDLVIARNRPDEITVRVLPEAGEMKFLRCWIDITVDENLQQTVLATVLDVTEKERTLLALHAGREEFRLAFEEAPTGMAVLAVGVGGNRSVLRVNRSLRDLLGVSTDNPTENHLLRPFLLRSKAIHARALRRLVARQESHVEYEVAFRRTDGSEGFASVRAGVARDPIGVVTQVLYHVLDVTDRYVAEQQLRRLALTDIATGVGNRTYFQTRLEEQLELVEAGGRALALVLLDLDRFKDVNDSLGHVAGDNLLREVGRRLVRTTPTTATVARLGGDEFAVLLSPSPSEPELFALGELIREELSRPYELESGDVVVCTASVGIARQDVRCTIEDVYRRADLALYEAKDAGRNVTTLSDNSIKERLEQRLGLQRLLHGAVAGNGVQIYLQPVVALDSGEVVGHEALVRVEYEDSGPLLPEVFMAVANESGLISEIDAKVAELAIEQLSRSRTIGGYIAVNVSPRTLATPGFLARVRSALHRGRVAPSRLHIELTEGSLVLDPDDPRSRGLAGLRAIGVQIGIDDFGTGYSALTYLDRVELDFLKIDGSLIRRMSDSPTAAAVVASIAGLAHVYRLTVTAEGVETADQADALRRAGVDRAQGWQFGLPQPVLSPGE